MVIIFSEALLVFCSLDINSMMRNASQELNLGSANSKLSSSLSNLPDYYVKLVELIEGGKVVDLNVRCETEVRNEEKVLETYWIVPHLSQACIVVNQETGRKRYLLLEPVVSEEEENLVNVFYRDMKKLLAFSSLERPEGARKKVSLIFDCFERLTREHSVEMKDTLKYKILYYLFRDFVGFGVIDGLMNDPNLEDISCDGYDIPVYVFHRKHGSMATNVKLESSQLDNFVLILCQKAGKFVSHANPLVDATLPDGSRLQVTYGTEVTPRGTSFTIRKFRASPYTPVDLMRSGTMSAEMLAYFWLLVENKMNFMVIGETASGKTTTLNALMMFIPPDAKVVSIEDTREIALFHENWIAEVTKVGFAGEGGITMYDLLKAALRQRPDYIIVGEVRGREAQTLFQAMSTGHAAYATLHAGNVSQLVYRLENEPLNVPRIMIQFLDAVIVQSLWASEGVRKRRVLEVDEIFGIDAVSKEMLVNPLFRWDPVSDSFSQESNSKKIEKIATLLGRDAFDVVEEVRRRAEYLKLLDKADVRDFREFVEAVQQYYSNPERALKKYGQEESVGVEGGEEVGEEEGMAD